MRRFPLVLLLMLVAYPLVAQRGAGTSVYPTEVYPGENVITVNNPGGIDRVRFRSGGDARVTVPAISGCPTSIDVRVRIDDPSSNDVLELTVHDCAGEYRTVALGRDSWDVRHEDVGIIEVGRDTCITAEVVVKGEEKTVDSILSRDSDVTFRYPRRGPWRVTPEQPLTYQICYAPDRPDSSIRWLIIVVRRAQPNGGLTQYSMRKPLSVAAVPPPPPPELVAPEEPAIPERPPLQDPTTFRTIIAPTTVTLAAGSFFAGNIDVGGWLGGYGLTDDIMLLAGGAYVPPSIEDLAVGTIGIKYRPLALGDFQAAVGFQYGYSSSLTAISAATPFIAVSYGSDANRINVSAGYAWKTHTNQEGSFNENASIVTIGADVTVSRGWKVAAETYFIEKSGLRPVGISSRWFNDNMAFDAGVIVDFEGTGGIRGTGTLSGEIRRINAVPVLSFLYVWK